MPDDADLIAQLTRERLERRADELCDEPAAPAPSAPTNNDVARIARQTGLSAAEVRRLSAST